MDRVLRVAVPRKSESFEISTDKGATVISGGSEAPFLEILMKKLRFKYTVVIPADVEWGSLVNGNWTGLIGLINRGEADMALGTLSITEDRLQVVDYSYPYNIKEITFGTRLPEVLTRDSAFMMPFSKDIWLAIFLLLLLLPLVFLAMFPRKYKLGDVLTKVVGILLRQSTVIDIQSEKQRVIFATCVLGVSFLSLIYSSVLLSFLTVPLRSAGIEDRHQLSKAIVEGSAKCAYLPGTSFLDRLLGSTDELNRIIGTYIAKTKSVISRDKGNISEYIYGGNAALIASTDFFKRTFHGNVFVSQDYFFTSQIAIAFDKSFRYKARLNRAIHEIAASGLFKKYEEDYLFKQWLSADNPNVYNDYGPKQLLIMDLKGIFIFLILGHALAFVSLILEVSYDRLKKRCRKNM